MCIIKNKCIVDHVYLLGSCQNAGLCIGLTMGYCLEQSTLDCNAIISTYVKYLRSNFPETPMWKLHIKMHRRPKRRYQLIKKLCVSKLSMQIAAFQLLVFRDPFTLLFQVIKE
jgi:hypothetical protein